MCGFSGFLPFLPEPPAEGGRRTILESMSVALAHRGPDDETFFDDGTLSFVFRRLSIIDLEGGQQPIWNEDRSLFVAVNGEIFNHAELRAELEGRHTFSTHSDCEVVLHLYEELGPACFERLNGMFAVALWDSKRQQLILARDRLGIKPLYFARTDGLFLFGSELKALLMHPDCPRELAWGDLEQPGVQQKPAISSYIQGVEQLSGGEYLIVSTDGEMQRERYWNFARAIHHSTTDKSPADFIADYQTLLQDAVTRQLMSDVPVGLFLSGGVDSSLIAALAAKSNQNLHCFTVVERTTVQAGDVQQAVALCEELGLPLHAVHFDLATIADAYSLQDFERLVMMIESPRFDPEWLFKYELHKFARKQVPGLKVVLLGQGADEFAGGYSNGLGSASQDWADYLASRVRPQVRRNNRQCRDIRGRMTAVNPAVLTEPPGLPEDDYHSLMQLLTWQLQHFNLWHEDRSSSLNSLEARVPFLDHRLVELLAGVPDDWHAELFWDKRIVREALKRFVPGYPEDKAKVPFFVTDDMRSIDEFCRRLAIRLYPLFRERYLTVNRPLFDPDVLEGLFARVESPAGDDMNPVHRLLEAMAVTIFHHQCQYPAEIRALLATADEQIQPVLTSEQLGDLEQLFPVAETAGQRAVSADDPVLLPAGCAVVRDLTDKRNGLVLTLLRGGKVEQRMVFPPARMWLVKWFAQLARQEGQSVTCRGWAERLQVDLEELLMVAQKLMNNGYLAIRSNQGGD